MFCTKCGQMLTNDGLCPNENCPSKSTTSNFNSNQNQSEGENQYQNYGYQEQYGKQGFNQTPNPYAYNNSNYSTEHSQDLMLFIGEKNTEYYMEKYTRYTQNENFASWNWAAFFLNIYWLLYRKMYGYAAAFFGIQVVVSAVTSIFSPILSLVGYILFGAFANKLYIKFALSKVKGLKFAIPGMTNDDIKRRISVNGGTNLAAPLILLGITVVLSILILIIFVIFIAAAEGSYRYYY